MNRLMKIMEGRMIGLAVMVLAALTLATACQKENTSTDPRDHQFNRVMIYYGCGQNNLDGNMKADIIEMTESEGAYVPSITDDNAIVVCYHGCKKSGSYVQSGTTYTIWIYRDYKTGGLVRDTLARDEYTTTADHEVMRELLTVVQNKFKANHYGIVFSSHGTGWLPQGSYTEEEPEDPWDWEAYANAPGSRIGSGMTERQAGGTERSRIKPGMTERQAGTTERSRVKPGMTERNAGGTERSRIGSGMTERQAGTTEGESGMTERQRQGQEQQPHGSFGQERVGSTDYFMDIPDMAVSFPMKLDYIIFDSCLMGCVEVAYQLSAATDIIGFSQAEVMSDGFYYPTITQRLLVENNPQKVVEETFEYYNKRNSTSVVSCVDCRKMEPLALCCRNLIAKYRSAIATLDENDVQGFYTENHPWFFDLKDIFVQAGADIDDLDALQQALDQCVTYCAFTKHIRHMVNVTTNCGFSMYLPQFGTERLNNYYKTLFWNKDIGLVE